MKKILISACAALILGVLIYVVAFNTSEKNCEGLYCEFLTQIETDFELTGGEKDQGYVFLRDHSELDTTTNRVIIHSIDGVYFAYPSADGWYAQMKGGEEKITLNELGHSLAEKEIEYEAEIKKMFDQKLKAYSDQVKKTAAYYNRVAQEKGFKCIDTSLFNRLTFESSFLAKELETLRQGEMTYTDFLDILSKSDKQISASNGIFGERPKIGFYSKTKNFFPVSDYGGFIKYMELSEEKLSDLEYSEAEQYMIKNKLLVSSFVDWYTWRDVKYLFSEYF